MYTANHYIGINGRLYGKGEAVPADLPRESVEWLLAKGAICRVRDEKPAGVEVSFPMPEPEPMPESEQESEIAEKAEKKTRIRRKQK